MFAASGAGPWPKYVIALSAPGWVHSYWSKSLEVAATVALVAAVEVPATLPEVFENTRKAEEAISKSKANEATAMNFFDNFMSFSFSYNYMQVNLMGVLDI
jgi:hypothetical protein